MLLVENIADIILNTKDGLTRTVRENDYTKNVEYDLRNSETKFWFTSTISFDKQSKKSTMVNSTAMSECADDMLDMIQVLDRSTSEFRSF